MLEQTEWGEFMLGDLFEIKNTLSFNTDKLVPGSEYDYITRTSLNQGILQTTGFVNEENLNEAGNWSLGLLQMDFFYRRKKRYAGQFVRKIIPKFHVSENIALYMSATLNYQKKVLLSVLVRDVDETFKKIRVKLPIKNGNIDFDFMDNFISKLKANPQYELALYLNSTGLKNYKLTDDELKALEDFKEGKIERKEFKMGDLFERISTKKLPYKAKELSSIPTKECPLPCLTSSFMNQGLNYYAPKANATILKDVISIPSNSDVYRAYFQSNEFTVLSDAYAIRWKYYDTEISSAQYLFLVCCINQVTDLPIYSYKNKLGGWNVVKEKSILLPTNSHTPDLGFMNNFITAIEKILIKDVVVYNQERLKASAEVIK